MIKVNSVPLREGYNAITVKSQQTIADASLKVTLLDSKDENIANIILKKAEEPKDFYLCEKENNVMWSEDNENWVALCKANDNIILELSKASGFARAEKPQEKNVVLVVNDNNLRFRAKDWLKEGYDVSNDCLLRGLINGNFQQRNIMQIPSSKPNDYTGDEDTIQFKCTGDNIPAIKLNMTNIGALHGYYCISSLSNDLGLKENAIGEIFTRKSDKQEYMLVRANDELVWFCPMDDEAMQTGNFGKYATARNEYLLFENDFLTDENGKEYCIKEDATQQQFRFSTNHRVQRAFLNGVCEIDLNKNGTHEADFIDFYESYDIIYLPAMLKFLRENKGHNKDDRHNSETINEAYMNFTSTHRFHRNGSYTVYQTNTALSRIYNVDYFGVMSMPFSVSIPHYIYAPESKNISVPTYQFKEKIYAYGNPEKVRSFYHMTDEKGSKSTNVGYYPYFEAGKTDERVNAVSRYGEPNTPKDEMPLAMYFTTHKMYPFYYNVEKMEPGEQISVIGYHTPAIPIDEEFFAINWHFVGEEIYLNLNCNKAVNKTVTTLPQYMNGLKITIEQKSEGFEIISKTIENNSISVCSQSNGYAILRLTKN